MHVFMGLETSWKRRSSQLLFVDENILRVGESISIVVDSNEGMMMDYSCEQVYEHVRLYKCTL